MQDSQQDTQEDSHFLAELDFGEEYINETGITLRDELTASSHSLSPVTSLSTCLTSRGSSPSLASRGSSPSVTPKQACKKRKTTADNTDVECDKLIQALGSYFGKREHVGDLAASMGQLVQSVANKLPFHKQVTLLEHITHAISTVTGKSEEEI